MPSFGTKSKKNLTGVNPELIRVLNEAIKRVDFSVIEGIRSLERQQELFRAGKSQTMNSKHLHGNAVDLIPYPFSGWANVDQFKDMALIILEVASQLGVGIRYGGNWTSFSDYPHFEIKGKAQLLPNGPTDAEIEAKLKELE